MTLDALKSANRVIGIKQVTKAVKRKAVAMVFIASEEAAIRAMEPNAENIFAPSGGCPFIVKVKEGKY